MTGDRSNMGHRGGNHGNDRNDQPNRFGANPVVDSQAGNRDVNKAHGTTDEHGGRDTDGAGTGGNLTGHNSGGGPAGRGGASGG